MQFLSLVYLLVVSKCSFGFPFFVSSVPKSIIRHNRIPNLRTIPALPTNSRFQRRRTPIQSQQTFYDSSDRIDNLMFADNDQYIEQRKMKDETDESSDLHPIYVLPPPDFQPIVYPTSRSDSVQSTAKFYHPPGYVIKRQIPYEYPNGLSSWFFGGLTGVQKNKYWDQLSPNQAFYNPVKDQPKQVYIYLKRTPEAKIAPKWPTFPTFEAHSIIKHIKDETNTINTINLKNKNKDKVLKTKLPVGLTSFFLGGMRGVSGRHWQMPPALVSQVEFMPNNGNALTNKKKSQYKPTVHFDDDNDFYNYNTIKVDK